MSEFKILDKPGFIHMVSKIKAKLAGKAATDLSNITDDALANLGAASSDLSNVEDSVFAQKAAAAGAAGTPIVAATSTDGVTYTATAPGVTELTIGLTLVIIPDTASTNVSVKLNVNGLGEKYIRLLTGYNTTTTTAAAVAAWMSANKPIQVRYNGTYWIADLQRASANAISGTIKIENGGTGATTAEEALTNLGAAPAYTYGTTDLTAGSSPLETGKIYLVYE